MNRLEERVADQLNESALAVARSAGYNVMLDFGEDPKAGDQYEKALIKAGISAYLSALESQGLKIVPVEVSTKMAGEGYVALRPYMERGERVKAARAVYAAMLNSVEE